LRVGGGNVVRLLRLRGLLRLRSDQKDATEHEQGERAGNARYFSHTLLRL
jgi:hypothetical protein